MKHSVEDESALYDYLLKMERERPSAPEWDIIAELLPYEWSLVLARENMDLACLWADIPIVRGRELLFASRKR